jgi:hypothetical protein
MKTIILSTAALIVAYFVKPNFRLDSAKTMHRRIIEMPRFLRVIGDSNTNPSYSFAAQFADFYKLRFENESFVGAGFKDFVEIEVSYEELILVHLGTNFAKDTASVSLFFEKLHAQNQTIIVVAPFAKGLSFDILREKLRQIAAQKELYYIEIPTEPAHHADKYHLNKEGHRYFFDKLNAAFVSQLILNPIF